MSQARCWRDGHQSAIRDAGMRDVKVGEVGEMREEAFEGGRLQGEALVQAQATDSEIRACRTIQSVDDGREGVHE